MNDVLDEIRSKGNQVLHEGVTTKVEGGYNSLPVVDWKRCVKYSRSEEGGAGVFFLEIDPASTLDTRVVNRTKAPISIAKTKRPDNWVKPPKVLWDNVQVIGGPSPVPPTSTSSDPQVTPNSGPPAPPPLPPSTSTTNNKPVSNSPPAPPPLPSSSSPKTAKNSSPPSQHQPNAEASASISEASSSGAPPPPPPPPSSATTVSPQTTSNETIDTSSAAPSAPPRPPPLPRDQPTVSENSPPPYKIAVKSSSTVVQDVFAGEILKSLDISCPHSKILNYAESEFRQMRAVLEYLSGDVERPKVVKEINRPFIMVMDFVEGAIDLSLPREQIKEYLNWTGEEGAPAQKRLQAIGELVCADVLLDNWDRLPVIWSNEGNPRNIFLRKEPPLVVAIDNLCVCPKLQFLGAHLEKVKLFLKDATDNEIGDEPPVYVAGKTSTKCSYKRIRDCILEFTGFDIGMQGLKAIRQGILKAIPKIAKLSHRELSFQKHKLEVHLPSDWGNVWLDGLNSIDLNALESVAALFKEANNRLECCSQAEWHSYIPFLNAEKLDSLKEHSQVVENNSKQKAIKITLFQQGAAISPAEGATLLDSHLSECIKLGYQLPDIVIFPEWWLHRGVTPTVSVEKFLEPFSKVVARYRIFALLGSFPELTSDKKSFNLTALMGRNGEILCTYRKQKPTKPGECDSGDSTQKNVVWTELGNIGVLICFDIENEDVLSRTLEFKPSIILNPIFIAPPHGFGTAGGEDMMYSHWKTAILQAAKKLERLAKVHNFTVVRVDKSVFGTTQVISPYKTITIPGRGIMTLDVWVDKMQVVNNPVEATEASKGASDNIRPAEDVFFNEFKANPPDQPRTWELENTGNRYSLGVFNHHSSYVTDATFYDAGRVVSASCDTTIKLFNNYLRRCIGTFKGHKKAVTAVECLPQVGGGSIVSSSFDGQLKIWSVNKFECTHSFEMPAAYRIRKTSDSNVFLTANIDGVVRIWDARQEKMLVGSSTAAPGEVFSELKQIGEHISVVGSDKGILRNFDIRVPEKYTCSWQAHTSRISALDIYNGGPLMSGSYDGTVKFWDALSGKELTQYGLSLSKIGSRGVVTGAAFVNQSKMLVSSSDSVLRLVDIATSNCLHMFHHHNSSIFRLAFDGLRFTTCGLDNTFVVGEFYQNCKLVKLGSILDEQLLS